MNAHLLVSQLLESDDDDLRSYVLSRPWPPAGFKPNGDNSKYDGARSEPFYSKDGRKFWLEVRETMQDRGEAIFVSLHGMYGFKPAQCDSDYVRLDTPMNSYFAYVKRLVSELTDTSSNMPKLPWREDYEAELEMNPV